MEPDKNPNTEVIKISQIEVAKDAIISQRSPCPDEADQYQREVEDMMNEGL